MHHRRLRAGVSAVLVSVGVASVAAQPATASKRAGYQSREQCLDQNGDGPNINDDLYCGQGANGRYYYHNDPSR